MNYLPTTTAQLTLGHLRVLTQVLQPLADQPQAHLDRISFGSQNPAQKFFGSHARALVCQSAEGRRALSVLTDEVTHIMQTNCSLGDAQYVGAVPVLVSSTNQTGMMSDQESWRGVAFHFQVGALTCVVPIITTPLTVEPDAVQAIRMRRFLPTSNDVERRAALAQLRISPDTHQVLGMLPIPRPQSEDADPASLRYLFDIEHGQGAAQFLGWGAGSVDSRGESMSFKRFLAGPPARVAADDVEVVLLSSHSQTRPVLLNAKAVSAAVCWSGLLCNHLCTASVRLDERVDTPRLVPLAQHRPHFRESWESIRSQFEQRGRRNAIGWLLPVRPVKLRTPYYVHEWGKSFMSRGSDDVRQWLQEGPVLDAFASWWGTADRNAMASILYDDYESASGI